MDANYRNPDLMAVAAQAPHCMNGGCLKLNEGDVVGCHSNFQEHGKGTGYKAHDLVAYLCRRCHDLLDGRVSGWDPMQKRMVFFDALYRSILWLLSTERLVLAKGWRSRHD